MTVEPISRKPLRLWPGVALVALQWLLRFVVPAAVPAYNVYGLLGSVALGVAIVVWWLFFSRAPWLERLGAVAFLAAAAWATRPLLDASIATAGMGKLFYLLVAPFLCLVLVGWAAVGRRLADGPRRLSLAGAVLLVSAGFTLVRIGGISGDVDLDLHWRWTATPEERLMAKADPAPLPAAPVASATPSATVASGTGASPASTATPPLRAPAALRAEEKAVALGEPRVAPAAPAAAEATPEWPGFRGPGRDAIVRGVRIRTDWAASPPVELWRRPIGPGWSSFAVRGGLLYTQEQRGEDEVVACYRVATGEPVWTHRDPARFWESHGGAGPRGTPALGGGRVYSLGATGILNALDAATGAVVWSRNATSETKSKVPGWGFAGSPLVVGDAVVVATGGTLAAYDADTGAPRWVGPERDTGYSSPHLVTVGGTAQVLLMNAAGATSVAASDGKLLWEHSLPSGARIVQPAVTADGDLLISDGEFGGGNYMRRIAVASGSAGWTSRERWASNGLKPNFNDFVVHKGHAYGFDGSILACLDLADGKRQW